MSEIYPVFQRTLEFCPDRNAKVPVEIHFKCKSEEYESPKYLESMKAWCTFMKQYMRDGDTWHVQCGVEPIEGVTYTMIRINRKAVECRL